MSTSTKHFDYLVIGGGSGGISSARRAAEHGASVCLVESGAIGGTCVNVGCVPKKVMFAAGNVFETCAKWSKGYGVQGLDHGSLGFDWKGVKEKRDAYVKRLNGIYDRNLEKSKVTRVDGLAKFVGEKLVEVNGEQYSGDHILVAVGGYPYIPDSIKGGEHAITSDGFFELEEQPKKVACIGAGYIAIELAGILNAVGSDAHLFYRNETFLRSFDKDAVAHLRDEVEHAGLNLHPASGSNFELKKDPETGLVSITTAKGTVDGFDCVIVAAGRNPNTEPLNLGASGIELDARGYIKVDPFQETTCKGVYAVGDVTNAPQLTPVAIAAGRKLSERLFNNKDGLKQCFDNVPSVIFSHPPMATCGISEDEAVAKFGEGQVKAYTSRFFNMFYALADQEDKEKTYMKLVCAGEEEKVVGIHLVGLGVDEMIQGFGIPVVAGLTKKDFDATVAVHPTSAEELVTMR